MTIAGREQISRLRAGARSNDLTASSPGSACTGARASRSVRWRRRCLSTCRACPASLSCLSLPVSGSLSLRSGITPMPGRAPKAPMRRSTPSFGLIVGRRKLSTWRWWSEHNAPAGGFSTSIAQSSGRTGRRDLAPHPHEKPSSRLRRPRSHRKPHGGYFPGAVNFARRGARTSRSQSSHGIFVNLHFKCQSMWGRWVSWGISEKRAEPRETGLIVFSSVCAANYVLHSRRSRALVIESAFEKYGFQVSFHF